MQLRVRAYTVKGAAMTMGVSPRTIEDWIAAGQLSPMPGMRGRYGERYYAEPDLARAERDNRRGRCRRQSARAA